MRARPRTTSAARLAGRAALLLGLLSPIACFGLSEQEQLRLDGFKYESKRFYEAREFLRAEEICRKGLTLEPDDVSLHQVLGFAILRQERPNRLPEVIAVFERAIDLDDEFDFKSHLGLGEAQYQLALVRQRNIDVLNADERLTPDERRERLEAERAEMQASLDRGEEALRAVLESPRGRDDTTARNALARLYAVSGRYADAADVLRPMVSTLARSARLRAERVSVDTLPREQRAKFEAEIATLKAQHVEALKLLATMAAKLDRHEEVVSVYNQVEAEGSMQPADWFNRAQAYELLGARDAAARDYDTFLRHAARAGASYTQIAERVSTAMERLAALRGGEPVPPGS